MLQELIVAEELVETFVVYRHFLTSKRPNALCHFLTIDLVTATLLFSNLTFQFAYCLLGCEIYHANLHATASNATHNRRVLPNRAPSQVALGYHGARTGGIGAHGLPNTILARLFKLLTVVVSALITVLFFFILLIVFVLVLAV